MARLTGTSVAICRNVKVGYWNIFQEPGWTHDGAAFRKQGRDKRQRHGDMEHLLFQN
jgi:hypothetical protein